MKNDDCRQWRVKKNNKKHKTKKNEMYLWTYLCIDWQWGDGEILAASPGSLHEEDDAAADANDEENRCEGSKDAQSVINTIKRQKTDNARQNTRILSLKTVL